MTKLQILALLLASLALLFFTSCDSEDFQEPDVYKVTPDLRLRINQGMKLSSKSERKTFKEKFDLFQEKCDEMDHITSPYTYMETEEYKDFIRAYTEHNFWGENKQVIENIERILRPYRESLIPAESKSRYPFRKYKNLITVHARFGAGGADFKDYRAFLTLNDSISFHNCLRLADRKNTSFIYLATDSSKLKEEFARFYGNRLIMSTEQAQHSARDLNEDSIAGAISTVTDFTILTMGALFIGTPMSSYSSLSEMQGGFDPLRVVPTEKSCSFGSVYLPT